MKNLHALVIGDDVRGAVVRMVERLGVVQVIAPRSWHHVVEQCCLDTTADGAGAAVVFGPPAFVLKHAATADEDFGFVMPVAQSARPWQRAATWRDDATLDLWRAGWSPRSIDRILVPTHDATVEFVIGDACPVPSVPSQPDGS